MNRGLILLVIGALPLFGLSLLGTNVLEYRNATDGYSFFENRADLFIEHNEISAGLRLEIAQPSRYSYFTESQSEYQGVSHKWISYANDVLDVRAGTFYETFGRGLVLDLFEDRRLVVDHRLEGARLAFSRDYIDAKGIYGKAEWDEGVTVQGGEITAHPPVVDLGATWLDYQGEMAGHTNAYSLYADIPTDWVNVYGEYAEKHIVGDGTDGTALYASADFTLGNYTFMAEYKDYESFYLRSQTLFYNNPPSCMREPSYTLQSRHVHNQQLSREQGFMVTHWGYYPLGLELEASFAQAKNPDFDDNNTYTEIYADIYRDFDSWANHLVYQYQDDGFYGDVINTFILNGYVYITEDKSLSWDLEYQTMDTESWDDPLNSFLAGAEAEIIDGVALGFEVAQIEEIDLIEGEVKSETSPWTYASIKLIENHSISIGAGKRAGGFTCAGGVCREEAPFEGFELSITSTF